MRTQRYYNPRTRKVCSRPLPATQREMSASRPRRLRKEDISLSPHAAEVRKFTELAKTLPDVRREKVEAIKKQIEAGTYKISAEQIAKKMMDSIP